MRIISADDLAEDFSFPLLVDALSDAFRSAIVSPVRHHHAVPIAGESPATLLLMPAWHDLSGAAKDGFLGVKVVSVYPGNPARGLPSVSGTYLLMAGRTGAPLATIDGQALTLWRTAAASALAASHLARKDARRLLMIGAGALAPYLIAAHASARPIAEIVIWNRTEARAAELAARLTGRDYAVRVGADLEDEIAAADIISCATLSHEPLVRGAWLKPGTHLDLVGAFTPGMRESDDDAVRRGRIHVDTRAGALKEAGDLVQPLEAGIIRAADIRGDLFDLCRGSVAGRATPDEITIFKSVGTALEDLAAAALAFERHSARNP